MNETEKTDSMTVIELKAKGYDIIEQMEHLRGQLQRVNQKIAQLNMAEHGKQVITSQRL